MVTRYMLMVLGDDDAFYWQAHWLILSLQAHAKEPYEIVIATDHPDYFNYFGDAIEVHGLSADEVAAWIGPQGHIFRAKFKLVELATRLEPTPGAIFYLDTDTVVYRGLEPLITAIESGAIYMDCSEYKLYAGGRRGNRGARRLWEQIGEREWVGIRIDRHMEMWNAGLIALPIAAAPLVEKAMAMCDAMLVAGITHRLTEQVAMSAVLTNTNKVREINPKGAEPYIIHYWGNKSGWRERITAHLASIHHRGLSLADAVRFFLDHPIDQPRVIRRTRKWHRLLGMRPVR